MVEITTNSQGHRSKVQDGAGKGTEWETVAFVPVTEVGGVNVVTISHSVIVQIENVLKNQQCYKTEH